MTETDLLTPDAASRAHAREELLSRARALKAQLGRAPTPTERLWFIVDARRDGLYVRGESSGDLAGVWGFATNTVEHSACQADRVLTNPAEVAEARDVVAVTSRRMSDEIRERARLATDRDAGALYQASLSALDTFAKAAGVGLKGEPAAPVGALTPEQSQQLVDLFYGAALRGGISRERMDALLQEQAREMEKA